MGYELEAAAPAMLPEVEIESDGQYHLLERRWQLANERLAEALAGYRALHGRRAPDDSLWLAAQMRLAWARQRCREASDDLASYEIDNHDVALPR
jgi:hypothetical protein